MESSLNVKEPFHMRPGCSIPVGTMLRDDEQVFSRSRKSVVWLFTGLGSLRALAAEAAGLSLPPELGPWRFARAVEMIVGEPDDAEALRRIERHGFCCFHAEHASEGSTPPIA